MGDDERFDALLMNVAQTQRGIEPLLDTVFSFLRRKTDFFTGASPEKVEDMVLQCVRKQAHLAEKAQLLKRQEEDAKRKKKLAQDALKQQQQQQQQAKAKAKAAEPPRFEEITDDVEQPAAVTAAAASAAAKAPAAPIDAKPASSDGDENDEDDGPPLVGNGGTTDKYVWTQTLQEAQVNFAVPEGTKSRQVDVVISATKLKVGLKGAAPFVDGPLVKKVKVDDSFWTLEDGNRICVYLQKDNQMEWWRTIIDGDAEIDTKKVQPENSKLTDLDADTRQTVEKMMFDQRQKALGLPSSDELQKQSILQKFMAQHPEMDFSNAKIN